MQGQRFLFTDRHNIILLQTKSQEILQWFHVQECMCVVVVVGGGGGG